MQGNLRRDVVLGGCCVGRRLFWEEAVLGRSFMSVESKKVKQFFLSGVSVG